MKDHEVPQDAATSHYSEKVHKLIYAVDDKGDFVGVKSAGWDAEADATGMALSVFSDHCEDSWARASRGETAALEYYMYYRRMDLALLAQTTGLCKWRIRRHFKPHIYQGLSDKLLSRYAQALEIDITSLRNLPAAPLHDAI